MSRGLGKVERRIMEVLKDGPATLQDIRMSYLWAGEAAPQRSSLQRALTVLNQAEKIDWRGRQGHEYVWCLPGESWKEIPDRRPEETRKRVVMKQYGDLLGQILIEDPEVQEQIEDVARERAMEIAKKVLAKEAEEDTARQEDMNEGIALLKEVGLWGEDEDDIAYREREHARLRAEGLMP